MHSYLVSLVLFLFAKTDLRIFLVSVIHLKNLKISNVLNRMIHISDFYQMFQSLRQFLEDYVPKKNVMQNFRPVGARETVQPAVKHCWINSNFVHLSFCAQSGFLINYIVVAWVFEKLLLSVVSNFVENYFFFEMVELWILREAA
jgi:hypothetical protein